MTKLSVLLTGATGYIAGLLLPALRERYDLMEYPALDQAARQTLEHARSALQQERG